MNFKNQRNYKTEVFYEDGKPFLRIEYDADATFIEDGIKTEVEVHCTIYKIALSGFKFNEIDSIRKEIAFNIHSNTEQELFRIVRTIE